MNISSNLRLSGGSLQNLQGEYRALITVSHEVHFNWVISRSLPQVGQYSNIFLISFPFFNN